MELIPGLVAVYAVICVAAYFGKPLIHVLPRSDPRPPGVAGLDAVGEIEIAGADGVTPIAWHAPARDDKPTILISMAMGPMPLIVHPKLKRSVRMVSAFST
jgi:hypothetical protein